MKSVRTLAVTLLVMLLPVFLSSYAGAAEPSANATETSPRPAPEEKALKEWQKEIAKIPAPKKGCFTATYPARQWKEVPCGPPSKYPNTVGGSIGNDVGPQVTPSLISSAVGSFDSVTPATVTETGSFGANPNAANAFSIQMNTRFFATPACASHVGCQGWQQFIYSQNQCNGPCVFMQYWLINYGSPCPSASWIQSGPSCWFNSASSAAPAISAAQLQNTTLTGRAQGGTDTVVVTSPGATANAFAADSVLNLENAWDTVDFIVVGDCCGTQANFSPRTTLIQRISVNDGSNKKPVCSTQASTGETNNLSFGPTAPAASGAGPALVYSESSSGGLVACAAATSVGDTHLTTFERTLYDFQAPGDFVLVGTPDTAFVVQARQQSGAPTWPNATINKAVATRMGKTNVAVCLKDTPLSVDGTPTALDDGKSLVLPSGVHLSRSGNVYSIQDTTGNSVRAELNGSYINVTVGLGHWPEEAHGLLLNSHGDISEIEARDGKVLIAPFPFSELYHHYANSWAVPRGQSLLDPCGERRIETGLPKKPFFAKDLPPNQYKTARHVCEQAGVRVKSLLDACTLDVAVIGSESAAKIYVGTPAPSAVGDAGGKRRHHDDNARNGGKDRDP
ncbi:VWD domain-containing protein [Paraburkholderia sp. GAS334]|uniref:VWD domain-containing protein n=1 Tax=Paraburkholderia sp. GAS334 TaxID=3035131 RepID=UPI003D1A4517